MQINLEAKDKHTVQAYSDSELQINNQLYQTNLIVSSAEILADWSINSLQGLDEETLKPLLRHQPKVIIIGHSQLGQFAPIMMMQLLSKQGIGLECMSIGAACRTFNVLLSEQRDVVLGIIF